MNELMNTLAARMSRTWRNALASAMAVAISWALARSLFGHEHPLFAAITPIICLAPGLPSHLRQAGNIILGVTTGILVGETVLYVVPTDWAIFRLVIATFLAIMIAELYGFRVVVAIQAGVSAMLVIAIGPISAGPDRLLDVLVGTAVGVLFSQVLITPDPVREIDERAKTLFRHLSAGFRQCLGAVEQHDYVQANTAIQTFSDAHARLVELGTGISTAREAARWSLRGRLAARKVNVLAARYERRALRLFASSLLFADALFRALRDDHDNMPAELPGRMEAVARHIADVEAGRLGGHSDAGAVPISSSPQWTACNEALHALENALNAYEAVFELVR
ncbi:uncharacterized membrane protein YgaE (UPF0421/DUF939 family) [Breoghania corrubedonensis]|uniref:Uncharacterized membrane protein YgaE (UPF0421/DUF939 family) n=1 Tax=Breoghania corrubedonensis TaxID=665038 RepID=A0A2T5VF90_9HYPH|nr:FUSC family protein [Breoghania corrubedonensis]PTW62396.1 uncharacterized membrane protein YgaE (UPF0421/DUF939 family) [Breoghania corrubedonensis]